MRVVRGAVFDVMLDIQKDSTAFAQWVGSDLNEESHKQPLLPEGFAHCLLVSSDSAEFFYKPTDYCAPAFERCIAWDDSSSGIRWH